MNKDVYILSYSILLYLHRSIESLAATTQQSLNSVTYEMTSPCYFNPGIRYRISQPEKLLRRTYISDIVVSSYVFLISFPNLRGYDLHPIANVTRVN